MIARLRRSFLAALAALPLLAPACTPVRNPATGEVEYTSMTPEDEARIGAAEHPKILARFGGEAEDPHLRAYVREIGERMVAVSELAGQRFTFTLLDSPEVNAFALPGGYVYVTRGILALADDEAELAGVIGHEIGHVTARHTAQRYTRAQIGQLGTLGAVVLGAVLGGETGARLGQQLGSIGAAAWVQGYSRQQEFEADELGIRYLVRAGYDPAAMASLLDSLEAWDRWRATVTGRSADSVPSWLASHPRTRDRVREAARRAGGIGGERGRDRHLARIDGMVFGDSPRHGWAEGRTFVHPELRFLFEVPDGFTLENRPDAVIAKGPGGALLLFDMAPLRRGQSLAGHLRDDLLQGGATGGLERGVSRGGFGMVTAAFRARVEGRPVDGRAAVLDAGDGRVYRFLFLAPEIGQHAAARFRETVDSLRRLSRDEAARFRPLRIEVVRLRGGESLQDLVARMDVHQGAGELFRALNDLDGPADLVAGRPVKLVRRR